MPARREGHRPGNAAHGQGLPLHHGDEPADDGILRENPELSSTKTNPASHGFGIPIMRRIAEKYDGIVSFSESDGWFTADAMLYMEE